MVKEHSSTTHFWASLVHPRVLKGIKLFEKTKVRLMTSPETAVRGDSLDEWMVPWLMVWRQTNVCDFSNLWLFFPGEIIMLHLCPNWSEDLHSQPTPGGQRRTHWQCYYTMSFHFSFWIGLDRIGSVLVWSVLLATKKIKAALCVRVMRLRGKAKTKRYD